jgi:hypothetical protein
VCVCVCFLKSKYKSSKDRALVCILCAVYICFTQSIQRILLRMCAWANAPVRRLCLRVCVYVHLWRISVGESSNSSSSSSRHIPLPPLTGPWHKFSTCQCPIVLANMKALYRGSSVLFENVNTLLGLHQPSRRTPLPPSHCRQQQRRKRPGLHALRTRLCARTPVPVPPRQTVRTVKGLGT